MNRAFAVALCIPRICARRLSTTAVQHGKPDLTKIKRKQKHFQVDDDTPVYLKGGPMDVALFYVTLGLLAASLATAGHSAYRMATKK